MESQCVVFGNGNMKIMCKFLKALEEKDFTRHISLLKGLCHLLLMSIEIRLPLPKAFNVKP